MALSAQDLDLEAIRARVQAVFQEQDTDTFFGTTVINNWINDACVRMSMLGEGYEKTDATVSTADGTRAYNIPTGATRISLFLYNGRPLDYEPNIDLDFFTSVKGEPVRYGIWANQVLLDPIPNVVKVLTFYFFSEARIMGADGDEPSDIPNRFRAYLADYAIAEGLYADGSDNDLADRYMAKFEMGCNRYREWSLMRNRQNFLRVRDDAGYMSNEEYMW